MLTEVVSQICVYKNGAKLGFVDFRFPIVHFDLPFKLSPYINKSVVQPLQLGTLEGRSVLSVKKQNKQTNKTPNQKPQNPQTSDYLSDLSFVLLWDTYCN